MTSSSESENVEISHDFRRVEHFAERRTAVRPCCIVSKIAVHVCCNFLYISLLSLTGTLRKTRRQRQRQRERHQTRGLLSKTMAVHVHFNSWYISLPFSAKQQREMTKSCVVWRT